MERISQRIRELRKRLGYTQAEFAEKVGVNQATVSRWETGSQEPEFSQAMTIAAMAGDDAVKLFFGDDVDWLNTDDSVPIAGVLETGRWVENLRINTYRDIKFSIPLEDRYTDEPRIGLLMQDDSMDLIYPRGSILFCIDTPMKPVDGVSIAVSIKDGDTVIVCRRRNDLYEFTARIFRTNSGREKKKTFCWFEDAPSQGHKAEDPPSQLIDPASLYTPNDEHPWIIKVVMASFRYENTNARLRRHW